MSIRGSKDVKSYVKAVYVSRTPWAPILAVVAILIAAVGGGVVTQEAIESGWYAELAKPAFNPPREIFGPVWTTLYVLMAIAFYKVWKRALPEEKDYQIAFFAQIGLNFLWSVAFFGMRSPWLGVAVILTLLATICTMMTFYARYNRVAVWLTIPYLLWVGFATLLNLSIALMN